MPERLVTLLAPAGTDEASHGTERYRVDNDGRVRVPVSAARYLLHNAGFVLAPETDRDGATISDIPAKD